MGVKVEALMDAMLEMLMDVKVEVLMDAMLEMLMDVKVEVLMDAMVLPKIFLNAREYHWLLNCRQIKFLRQLKVSADQQR